MSTSTPNTIILERVGELDIHEAPGRGTIKPGYLVAFEKGGSGSLVACATAAFPTQLVAVENPYDDAVDTKAIDSPYVSSDTVRYIFARPGDLLYMFLDADSSSTTAKVTMLYAHDTGALDDGPRDATAGGTHLIGFAWDGVTSPQSGMSRQKVRIM